MSIAEAQACEEQSLTYSVAKAGKMLGLCRNTAYKYVRDGSIPSIKVGNRFLVPKAVIDRMLGSV